jgi:hypothetical protein
VTDEQKPDKAMAGMLKRKSVWPPASTREACPDAATLAAYFDRSLSASEISHCELHFSACLRCQEQLAALARSELASVATPEVEKKPAISWIWAWHWMAPVGAAVIILVFIVSYRTMLAPGPRPSGAELMAKREAATPAVAEPQKPADSKPAKIDALDVVSGTKSLSAPRQVKTRNELDELQRKNAAAALDRTQGDQTLKDKRGRLADDASRAVASRVMAKPADEEKQVAAAENRPVVQPTAPTVASAIPPGAQAGPVQGAAPSVLGAQKQDRAIAVTETKEPVAQAPAEVQAKEQAALKKESEAGRQDTVGAPFALKAARPSASKSLTAPDKFGEFIVATPNSRVLWRFGSAGRIERSRDAGKTWETQKSPAQESFLSGSAPSGSICWVGGSNGVLLRTIDGGENWERIPSPTKSDIIVVKATDQLNVTVIDTNGRTYETRNAGAHWLAR